MNKSKSKSINKARRKARSKARRNARESNEKRVLGASFIRKFWGVIFVIIFGVFLTNSILSNVLDVNNIIKRDQTWFFKLKLLTHTVDWEGMRAENITPAIINENVEIACAALDIYYQTEHSKPDASFETVIAAIRSEHDEIRDCYFNHDFFKSKRVLKSDIKRIFVDAMLPEMKVLFKYGVNPDSVLSFSKDDDYRYAITRVESTKLVHKRIPGFVTSKTHRVSRVVSYYMPNFKTTPIPIEYSNKQVMEFAKTLGEDISNEAGMISKRKVTRASIPMRIAMDTGNVEYVKLLLDNGAKVGFREGYIQAHHFSEFISTYGTTDFARDILRASSDWNELELLIIADDYIALSEELNENVRTDEALEEILDKSVQFGSINIMRYLHEDLGVSFDSDSLALLVKAYFAIEPWGLDYLLSLGIDPSGEVTGEEFRELMGIKLNLFTLLARFETNNSSHYSKKVKFTDMLLDFTKKNNPSMAFILESHFNNWAVFHHLVAVQNVDKIHELLQADPGLIDTVDGAGQTPLILATRYQLDESIKALLEYPQNLDKRDRVNTSALFYAVHAFDLERVKLLVSSGASLSYPELEYCSMALSFIQDYYIEYKKTFRLAEVYGRSSHSPLVATIHRLQDTYDYIEAESEKLNKKACLSPTEFVKNREALLIKQGVKPTLVN